MIQFNSTHRYLLQERLHWTELAIHKIIHERHVLFFGTKLGKVSEVLDSLSNECEIPGLSLLGELLCEVEEARGQDGRTEEAQEYTRWDEVICHVLSFTLLTALLQGRKYFT